MSTEHIDGRPGSSSRRRNQDAFTTPKVLHELGGRSMPPMRCTPVSGVAPQHLVVVLGHEREQVGPLVRDVAEKLGPIDVAIQEEQLGTGHAVLCGLSALPADFDGVLVVTSGDTHRWTPTHCPA